MSEQPCWVIRYVAEGYRSEIDWAMDHADDDVDLGPYNYREYGPVEAAEAMCVLDAGHDGSHQFA